MGASVMLRSAAGERTVPLAEFYTGLRKTVMRADELMAAVNIPSLAENERGIFLKLGLRRVQAISVVNVAIVITEVEGVIQRAAITLGCVAPIIVRAPAAEEYLREKPSLHRTSLPPLASLPKQCAPSTTSAALPITAARWCACSSAAAYSH